MLKKPIFWFAVSILCIVKFAMSPMSEIETMIWLLPGAVAAFFTACIMGSLEDDRKHGDHATRDGFLILAAIFVIAKFPMIIGVIWAIGYILIYK